MSRSKDTENKNFEMAIYEANYDAIVDLTAQHRSKKNSFSFCEQLKHIKEDELKKLMKQLLKILMEYVQMNLLQNDVLDFTSLSPEQCKSSANFIQAVTDIGLACIQCELASICHNELTHIAVFLQDIMLPMPDSMDYVKNFISLYCEKLYSSGASENCEEFLNNVVLYLVRRTFAKKANKNAVKRLYVIRNILIKVMNRDRPNAAQLWSLFLDCAVSQVYLDCLEGTKTIGLVMSLDYCKLLDFHEKIKSHLQSAALKNALAFGRIYFEAWNHIVKAGNKDMRDVMEVSCLKELIEMAIISQQRNISLIIRKMLSLFVLSKKDPEVSKMLYSIYQPIIYRYLKNPGGLYRAAAAQLFLDVFPLEEPNMTIVKKDVEINEQLLMIRSLLLDDFPIVRITAILGVSVSLSVNWEVFPEESLKDPYINFCKSIREQMLKTYFRIIVDDLSRDSASSEVRVSVVKGLKCMLENPLIVRCLVKILPKVSGLFHDTSENVRIAFCQLLLKVKKISAIKYFDIVPLNQLFARMEEDTHAVKKCLSNLLNNSYFPRNRDPKEWLGRSLQIIRTERIASRIFFTYVSNFIGVDISVKFMIQAVKALHLYVKTKSSSSRTDMEICDKENIQSFTDYVNTLEEAVGFGDLNVVITLMESIAVMWLSLKPDSDSVMTTDTKKKFLKMLVGKSGPRLSELCLYYKDTKAWESVFYLSSFLPSPQVPCLASLCFEKLKKLPPDAKEPDYIALLQCLANQFQMHELLTLLKDWIEVGLADNVSVTPPTKKRRGKGKSSKDQEQAKPYLANRMLDSILNLRNLQKYALLERAILQDILHFSDNIKRKLEKTRKLSEAEAEFLNLLLSNIVRISVHLHPEMTSIPLINEFVEWTSNKLVKHIVHVKDEASHFTTLVLGICEILCTVLGDVMSLDFFDPECSMYLDFIYSLLCTGYGYKFLSLACSFLYKHAASCEFMSLGGDTTMLKDHLCCLNKVLDLINNEAMLEKLSDTELKEITNILALVMPVAKNEVKELPNLSSQVFKCILKNILDCCAAKCANIVEEKAEDPFDSLPFPTTGNFFWSVISKNPQLSQDYIKYLTGMLKDSQNIDASNWIAYWMITWRFLNSKSISQPVLRDITGLVVQLQKSLHNLYPSIKDSEKNNVQDSSEPLQLFQRHCHAELIKLKKCFNCKRQLKADNN